MAIYSGKKIEKKVAFKQKNYEETILKNFAESIKNQLILRLSVIK